MKLTPNCEQKIKDGVADIAYEYNTDVWDAECIADYFFMKYNPSEIINNMDVYYRDFTMFTVLRHYRKKRERCADGKYYCYLVSDECYIISKYDIASNSYLEVYRTDNMNIISNIFQMFNEYSSIAWYVDYKSFIEPFMSLMVE